MTPFPALFAVKTTFICSSFVNPKRPIFFNANGLAAAFQRLKETQYLLKKIFGKICAGKCIDEPGLIL